mmetsp:Transcript_34314/g.81016  ORF Transcript_34314/g.81016 Transcript_34314/m.81016 type:complete len:225 (+) Transcript_34314:937-1611(+)
MRPRALLHGRRAYPARARCDPQVRELVQHHRGEPDGAAAPIDAARHGLQDAPGRQLGARPARRDGFRGARPRRGSPDDVSAQRPAGGRPFAAARHHHPERVQPGQRQDRPAAADPAAALCGAVLPVRCAPARRRAAGGLAAIDARLGERRRRGEGGTAQRPPPQPRAAGQRPSVHGKVPPSAEEPSAPAAQPREHHAPARVRLGRCRLQEPRGEARRVQPAQVP